MPVLTLDPLDDPWVVQNYNVWGRPGADHLAPALGTEYDVVGWPYGPEDTGGATIIAKAGGARSSQVGGAAKQVQAVKLGGGAAAAAGGGERSISLQRAGGGVLGASAGGAKLIEVARAGGGASGLRGGGIPEAIIARAGGARLGMAGGGAKLIEAAKLGGAASPLSGGAARLLAIALSGGGAAVNLGGGAVEVITPVGVIERTGGGKAVLRGGGTHVLIAVKLGGGAVVLLGGGAKLLVPPGGTVVLPLEPLDAVILAPMLAAALGPDSLPLIQAVSSGALIGVLTTDAAVQAIHGDAVILSAQDADARGSRPLDAVGPDADADALLR